MGFSKYTKGNSRMRDTIFSPCRTYRYSLWREWAPDSGVVMFIGLNPSTADEIQDDPTIRRCIGFARAWGYGALCMGNLFAFRATDPAEMLDADDPVGPENDRMLVTLASQASLVVAAWGNDGSHRGRSTAVRRLIPELNYLKRNLSGQPAHPLYLPGNLKPKPFNAF